MMRVMVVEDEQLVSKGIILTTDWQKMGCEVVAQANNGLEGFELFQKLKPDIVITDVRMPGLDGIEMIRRIRTTHIPSEFIIISGYSEFEYARRAIQLGVKDFLIKPIDDSELEQALANACSAIHDRHILDTFQKNAVTLDNNQMRLVQECMMAPVCYNDTDYVSRAVKYIASNFQNDISIKSVADYLFISESYLSRLFKVKMGKTFGDYLTYFRIKTACNFLRKPDIKVNKIANMVGYKDQRYFSVIFKKIVGMTPREFRENLE